MTSLVDLDGRTGGPLDPVPAGPGPPCPDRSVRSSGVHPRGFVGASANSRRCTSLSATSTQHRPHLAPREDAKHIAGKHYCKPSIGAHQRF